MKEPRQWVYIIERKANEVKVGTSINPNQRIADIQRIGGFEIIRTEILGPFQNGYKVETEIHHRLHTHQIVSEWFLIPFEQAVLIAKEVAEKIGDRNIVQDSIEVDYSKVLDFLFPKFDEIKEFFDAISQANLIVVRDVDGKIWFESEEYGLFRPEFLMSFMSVNKMLTNGEAQEEGK